MGLRTVSGLSRAVVVIAVSGLGAACSSDVARFDENPFRSSQVASAPQPSVSAAPVAAVESQPLPSRDFVVTSPPPATAQGGSPFGQGGDPGMTTGTVTPRSTFGSSNPQTPAVRQMAMGQTTAGGPVSTGRGGWSSTGGTAIRAAAGDTPEGLSRRYGVPAAAIAQANGIAGNQAFAAGQNVIIPTYSVANASQAAAAPVAAAARPATDLVRQPADAPQRAQAPAVSAARTAAVAPAPQQGRMNWQAGAQPTAATPAPTAAAAPRPAQATRGTHTVTGGETLAGVARRYGVPRDQLAAANSLQPGQALRTGQVLRLPAVQASTPAATRQAAAAPVPAPAAAPVARREQAQRAVAEAQATPAGRQADPQPTAAIPSQATITQSAAQPSAAAAAETASANAEAPARAANAEPQFRWPVRGRVVAGFRAGTNDGIKLSVPQGTPVKAAEDGVVAYAGNELRGYGNLVLVRHSNGYVTAYAHNSTIAVRRGEQVRRGQTIAAAGQTGNVSSPQLHFEIRRGATPVDPMTFLGSN
ncbi:LysM peptidoglycan-binding domain-containing M23 family metallopeptidase [Phreatobacter sp.]|uniref:LysM peptidoglycan-binding domain-containing M23 family metallopeptidase n=1 Tax=Phreatobacter sp. TaxID=1966341 RepID=UPI0022CC0FD7|nr:LysM peptidoglycan-binding domain-containing M23 family metallopeptidase [Phreatobacter sp.]MCZ8314741.1 LysM peptidoglycan-binding domain-containing M23 family metallopeptidase [Phreatobacter sp.]